MPDDCILRERPASGSTLIQVDDGNVQLQTQELYVNSNKPRPYIASITINLLFNATITSDNIWSLYTKIHSIY